MADVENFDTWWAINGIDLMNMLRRAHAGEDPEFVYIETYINADVESFQEDEDE